MFGVRSACILIFSCVSSLQTAYSAKFIPMYKQFVYISVRVCVWTCEYVGDKILFFICLFNPFRHNMHFLILFWGIYNQEAFPKTTNNSFLIPFNINAIIYITNQTFLRIMQLLIRYDEACQNFLLAAFFVVFYLFSVLSYHFTLLVVLYLLFSIIPFLL